MQDPFMLILGGVVIMGFLLGAAALLLFRQRPGEGRDFHPDSSRSLYKAVSSEAEVSSKPEISRSRSFKSTFGEKIDHDDEDISPQLPRNLPVAVLEAQKGEGRSWLLRYAASTSIGRFDDCDIAINDNDVSRLHAQITHRIEAASAHEFSIFDYSSTNGTIVNGQPISAVASLQDGDQIQIGKTEFIFRRVKQKGSQPN